MVEHGFHLLSRGRVFDFGIYEFFSCIGFQGDFIELANSAVAAIYNLFAEVKSGRCINFIPIFCESVMLFDVGKGIIHP